MTYELRPGIVYTKICGEYLLIPNRKAAETCPSIRHLNILGAVLIETIVDKKPMEKAYRVYEILSRKTTEEAHAKIDPLIEDLVREGFLIEVPETQISAGTDGGEEERHDTD